MPLGNHHQSCFFTIIILHFVTISISAHIFPSPISVHNHGPLGALYNNLTTYHPGHVYKGLSNIKSHFHRLGYIPNAPLSNFNDNFDDTLISAIQTYQENYKLNVTGELDHDTLRHMMIPRCGVPDTPFVSNYSFFPGSPRWPRGTTELTYAYASGIPTSFRTVISRAFTTWAPVVKINFRETTSYQNANIRVAFFRGDHGDGYPFDGPQGILAHAFAPTNGWCHFDSDERWVPDVTQSPGSNNFDLESVAVHEIGHVLGLGHSNDLNAIMYHSISPGARKVQLGQDDIQGIKVLYNV